MMSRIGRYVILILLCLCCLNSFAQEKEKKEERSWFLNGYIKNLQTISQLKNTAPNLNLSDDIYISNLFHNRLNFKWYPSNKWTMALEQRNRLFLQPFSPINTINLNLLDSDAGFLDFSFVRGKTNSGGSQIVAHSQIDRAWASYAGKKFEVKIGRQRVNWGINTVWNPNDIFNAYNFLDFDYEERSGTDAVRGTYYLNDVSSLELVIGSYPKANFETKAAYALRYETNWKNYDFQAIGGLADRDLTLGGGFAGNLGNAGLKGELQYFTEVIEKEGLPKEEDAVNASLTLDYVFGGAIYTFISGIYSNANSDFTSITPKYLWPYKWAGMISASGGFSPIGNASAAIIYAPETQTIIFTPSASIAISESWDIALFSQIFWAQNHTMKVQNLSNSFFLRMKWSF